MACSVTRSQTEPLAGGPNLHLALLVETDASVDDGPGDRVDADPAVTRAGLHEEQGLIERAVRLHADHAPSLRDCGSRVVTLIICRMHGPSVCRARRLRLGMAPGVRRSVAVGANADLGLCALWSAFGADEGRE